MAAFNRKDLILLCRKSVWLYPLHADLRQTLLNKIARVNAPKSLHFMGHLSPYKFEPVAAAAIDCRRKQPMTHEVNQSVADVDHQ